jgi:hypothetical protein
MSVEIVSDGSKRPHTCHAEKCVRVCPPYHLMCGKHWAMLTPELRRRVQAHYQAGQCTGKVRPSLAWFTVARLAIMHVAEIEKTLPIDVIAACVEKLNERYAAWERGDK